MDHCLKTAFKVFLETGGLSATARFLNTNGHSLKRTVQGGNSSGRSGIFTIGNLDGILQNKAYIGIRRFKSQNGTAKEVKACWPAIIDKVTFERVQAELSKRHECKRKPESENRYPFLLTGLVRCASCGAQWVENQPTETVARFPIMSTAGPQDENPRPFKKFATVALFAFKLKKLSLLCGMK